MRLTLVCLQCCLCLFSLFMLMGTQCAIRSDNRSSAVYTHVVHVSPVKEMYHTGDTIWFSCSNPTHQFSRKDNGRQLVLDTLSVPVSLTLSGGFDVPKDSSGDYAEFLTDFGANAGLVVGNFMTGVVLNYGCNTAGSYDFRIGVRWKKPGIYVIGMGGGWFANCPERTLKIGQAWVDFTLDAGTGNDEIFQSLPDSVKALHPETTGEIAAGQALAVSVE